MNTNASPLKSKLLYGAKPQVPANGQDPGIVKIRLRDDRGRPVTGRTVLLTADRDNVTIEQPGPTDAEGAAFGYVRTTVPGPVVVSGTILPLTEEESNNE
jgi:hypothetical protein